MAKPKAQTLQQRFGFLDDDLKKPKHDEIMLWLNNCVDEKLQEWLDVPKEWTDDEIAKHRQEATGKRKEKIDNLREQLEHLKSFSSLFDKSEEEVTQKEQELKRALEPVPHACVPGKPPIKIELKLWEHPIKNQNYIVGFADMMVVYKKPYLSLSIEFSAQGWIEKWIVTEYAEREDGVFFEVKTEIPSLGELIRQINMYRTNGARRFFVVSPDDSYARLLKEQGIGMIRFP